jgi:L-ascorbate metabolism protein UlaG (beta-lactamase superfamily)
MKAMTLVALLAALLAGGGEAAEMTTNLHWLGHDGFRVDGPPVVYIDPFQLSKGAGPADLILITHDHFDHCSPDDVARIRGPKTVVVGPQAVATKLPGPVQVIAPGDTRSFVGVEVKAVPAYNTNKAFHPQRAGNVGYVIRVGGITYYHAGDTDRIPEMAGLAPDIALLPVSGTYVMTADEAALAARDIRPKVVVPMHYGAIVGGAADAGKLAKLLEGSGIEVVIKTRE